MNARPFGDLKKKNLALSRRDLDERPPVCRAMPVKVTVNNTHRCNLTCPLCFKRFEPGHNMAYGDMPFETFSAVAEDVFPYADEVALSVSGEPLLSPTIEDELELGVKYGVHFAITTNGVLLGTARMRELVLKHVHVLHLSLDAGTRETFERIREGAQWDQVFGALKDLLRERESGPRIYANFVMMRENIEELPQWVALMSRIGVDGCFAEHVIVPRSLAVASLVRHKRLAVEMMDEAKTVARRCGIPFTLPPAFMLTPEDETMPVMRREEAREMVELKFDVPGCTARSTESDARERVHVNTPEELRAWNERMEPGRSVHCPYAWRETWIHHQGAIFSCDTNNFPHPMGTVPKDQVTGVWNSLGYQKLRKQLVSGEVYSACRHCHVMGRIENHENSLTFVKGP